MANVSDICVISLNLVAFSQTDLEVTAGTKVGAHQLQRSWGRGAQGLLVAAPTLKLADSVALTAFIILSPGAWDYVLASQEASPAGKKM